MRYLARELTNSLVIEIEGVKYVCLSVYRDTDEKHVIVTTMPYSHWMTPVFVAFTFLATKVFEVTEKVTLDFSVQKVR